MEHHRRIPKVWISDRAPTNPPAVALVSSCLGGFNVEGKAPELVQPRLIRHRGPFDPVCRFVSRSVRSSLTSCRAGISPGPGAELFPMHDRIAYQGITFDDVLLEPGYSELLPHDVDAKSQ